MRPVARHHDHRSHRRVRAGPAPRLIVRARSGRLVKRLVSSLVTPIAGTRRTTCVARRTGGDQHRIHGGIIRSLTSLLGIDGPREQGHRTNHDRCQPPRHRCQAGGRCRRGVAAAAAAARVHRPGAGALQPQGVHRGGQGARRGAGPRAVRGAPRPGQDHARPDHGARAGRGLPLHLRPRDRQGGGPRRAAHQPGGPRRPVHRRDPPPQPGGGGDPLSRHGGLPARPHHRRGAGGALGQDRAVALHADRRHHAHGAADHAAARPLRHPRAAQLLHPRRAGIDRHARRRRAQGGHQPGRRGRDRAPLARHAPHRRPPAAPRARLRRRGQGARW